MNAIITSVRRACANPRWRSRKIKITARASCRIIYVRYVKRRRVRITEKMARRVRLITNNDRVWTTNVACTNDTRNCPAASRIILLGFLVQSVCLVGGGRVTTEFST